MKKIILLFLFYFIFLFGNHLGGVLSAQWIPQTAPTGTTALYSVYAISPTSVACAGAQRVIRTLDGGLTWTSPLSLGGVNIYTIHSGVSTSWLSLTQNSGWMMKMGNPGGITLTYGSTDSIMAVHFNTPGCATAVGTVGKIETTCDSGATWQTRIFTGLTLNSVWYANTNTGVACGVFGSIKRTLNGGVSWVTVTSPVSQNLNGVTFADSLTGYIVGNAGSFMKTIDGGATWTSMPLSITNNINGIYFVSADTGYVVGTAGLIKKTVNGGNSWTTMASGTTQALRSVHFTNSTTGWVCGDGGVILKYCPTLSAIGSITGSVSVCAGDTLTYSGNAVSGASGYTWTMPSGWTGGSASTSITLVAGYTSGNITMAPNNSCGSGTSVTLAVTVNSPPIPVITQSVNMLTSSSSNGNQWYLNGSPIAGATGQTYNFTSNGIYTVVVTAAGCSSESLPHAITNAGIDETSTENNEFVIFPNPSNGFFKLTVFNRQLSTLKITDVLGNVILQSEIKNTESEINLNGISNGIYFIQLLNENKKGASKKLIIK